MTCLSKRLVWAKLAEHDSTDIYPPLGYQVDRIRRRFFLSSILIMPWYSSYLTQSWFWPTHFFQSLKLTTTSTRRRWQTTIYSNHYKMTLKILVSFGP